jgi:hypothetical protein
LLADYRRPLAKEARPNELLEGHTSKGPNKVRIVEE